VKRLSLLVSALALLALGGCGGGTGPGQTTSPSAAHSPITAAVSPRPPKAGPNDIAFVRSNHIWRAHADGSGAVQITEGPGSDDAPAWSPDRAQLAYAHDADIGVTPSTLCLVSLAGGPAHRWRFASEILGLCFSPDGRSIACADQDMAGHDTERIVILDISTGQQKVIRTLHDRFATDMMLSWSPDGKRLLVGVARQDGDGQRAGLLTLASGRLVWLSVRDASDAQWSPSGDAILVSQGTQSHTQLALAGVSGAMRRVLVRGGGYLSDQPWVWGARLSPDGSRVCYCKDSAIWTVGADGKNGRRLGINGGQPAWASQ
jgi:Tol biopolymer transport system component